MDELIADSFRSSVLTAIDKWGDMVLRLALCRTNNKADAEDIFQTVFLKLLQKETSFETEEHKKAWLLRVTLNCCKDLYRKASYNQEIPFDEAENYGQKETSKDGHDYLHIALNALSLKQRIVVHLFYFEGYTTDEIADITEENPATVRSHLHRARIALKLSLIGGVHE